MRFLAVVVLVLGHAAMGWPDSPLSDRLGSLVGYSIIAMFVCAGFIATAALIREHEHTGDIALGKFVGRRAVRILPTIIAFTAITTIHHSLNGVDVPFLRVASLLGFVANYYNALAHDDGTRHVVGHLWSIAVSVQFLLVWVIVLRRQLVTGKGRPLMPMLLGTVVFAAALRAIFVGATDVSHAYIYNATETRVDALAIGAFLALAGRDGYGSPVVEQMLRAPIALVLAVVITLIAISAALPAEHRFSLGFSVEALATAVLLGVVTLRWQEGMMRRMPSPWNLATAPRRLSAISLSLFVWHHYGLAIGRRLTPDNEALVLATTFAVALIAYATLERPFRWLADRLRAPNRQSVQRGRSEDAANA